VNGVIITILPATLFVIFDQMGFKGSTFGDADFGWFGTVLGAGFLGGSIVGVIVAVAIAAVLVVAASIYQRKVVDTGWLPGAKRDKYLASLSEKAVTTSKPAAAKPVTSGKPASSGRPASSGKPGTSGKAAKKR